MTLRSTHAPLCEAVTHHRLRLRVLIPCLTALVGAVAACDLTKADDPPEPAFTQITFRIEADLPPNGGWLYWYVENRILYRKGAGQSSGPYGVRADCGTHAGIAALVNDEPPVAERLALVIETVEDDPVVARQEFSGPGEHQLIVLVTCPEP